MINEFYDKVIENYDYTGNYLILLIHDTYDVPGKTTDGIMMDDASDEVHGLYHVLHLPRQPVQGGTQLLRR